MSLTRIALGLAWLVGWVLVWRVPRLPRANGSEALDPVTIIIPARNEASSLPNLLGDLAAHRPPGARVLVVDDGSEDDTAAIARSFDFVEVITAEGLRDGWLGKTWACHTGARAAVGGTLVFLDADVRVHGDAIERAVRTRADRGGLLTIWPYHVPERPYEHASAIFNLVSMAAAGTGSLIPPRQGYAGFGPFMVTSKTDYDAVGGHEAVRGSVIEDFALSRRYGEAGHKVTNLGGGSDVTFRMYPDGFRSLLDGWTKNYGLGLFALPIVRLLAIIGWLTAGVGLYTLGGGVERHVSLRILGGLYVVQFFLMFRMVGRFSVLCALLYPLQILFLVAVLLRSLWRTFVRKKVTWRGRDISTT
ncbi:MAG: glycosyltransferase [Planctomycetota bacterium]|nr:glycosyltransferase [Planctomycetota bacterium]